MILTPATTQGYGLPKMSVNASGQVRFNKSAVCLLELDKRTIALELNENIRAESMPIHFQDDGYKAVVNYRFEYIINSLPLCRIILKHFKANQSINFKVMKAVHGVSYVAQVLRKK